MDTSDEILRAYSLIMSIKNNIPNDVEVNERWVNEYNKAVEKIEGETNKDLTDFKVPENEKRGSISSFNDDIDELWCERKILIQKIDAILIYFTVGQAPANKRIGFVLK